MRARLVTETHGLSGSSGDYELSVPFRGAWRVRVSLCWICSDLGYWEIIALSADGSPAKWWGGVAQALVKEIPWEDGEIALRVFGYDADPFPLRNNPYLNLDYRRQRGWGD